MESRFIHLFVEILLKEFFPFIGRGKITAVASAEEFDFSSLHNVELTGVRFAGKEWDSFIFVIAGPASRPSRLAGNRRDREEENILKSLRFYGIPAARVEWVEGGSKNLSVPADAWKKRKLMVRISEGDSSYVLALPAFLFETILEKTGTGWCGEVSALREDKLPPLDKIFSSLLFSRQEVFLHHLEILRLLPRQERSDFIRSLLESGYIDEEHLASLLELRPEGTFLLNCLPEKTADEVKSLRVQISEFLTDPHLRIRWGRQLEYYLQNVFSRICLSRDGEGFMGSIYGEEGASLTAGFQYLRNELRDIQFPPGILWERFLSAGKLNPLITSPGKDILAMLAASGDESLPLNDLFKHFRPSFGEELRHRIGEQERGFKRISRNRRMNLREGARSALRELMEREITRDLAVPMRVVSLEEMYLMMQKVTDEERLILYNHLGFETFTAFFEILRDDITSPLEEGEAEKILMESVSSLPLTEASIVEDIYFQKLNWNRIVTEEGLQLHLRKIREKIPCLKRLGYIRGAL